MEVDTPARWSGTFWGGLPSRFGEGIILIRQIKLGTV